VFSRYHYIHVVAAPQAVIKDRQQAVPIGWQIHPHNIGFLVDDMVDKTGVLVREAVVILLPDMGGKEIVERCDRSPLGEFRRDLQPFSVLAEH